MEQIDRVLKETLDYSAHLKDIADIIKDHHRLEEKSESLVRALQSSDKHNMELKDENARLNAYIDELKCALFCFDVPIPNPPEPSATDQDAPEEEPLPEHMTVEQIPEEDSSSMDLSPPTLNQDQLGQRVREKHDMVAAQEKGKITTPPEDNAPSLNQEQLAERLRRIMNRITEYELKLESEDLSPYDKMQYRKFIRIDRAHMSNILKALNELNPNKNRGSDDIPF